MWGWSLNHGKPSPSTSAFACKDKVQKTPGMWATFTQFGKTSAFDSPLIN